MSDHISIGSAQGVIAIGRDASATGVYNEAGPASRLDPDPTDTSARVLVVVVADVERQAVLEQVAALTGAAPVPDRGAVDRTYDLGRIGDVTVVLAQVWQGTVTPGSAGPAMPDLLRQTRPDCVIMTGICFGLKEDDARDPQQLGDVLVATELRLTGHFKAAGSDDGATLRQERGGRPHASTFLLNRLRDARQTWRNPTGVYFGPIVSESVLSSSWEHRERIRSAEPEAIGGEMEGAAVYAAAERAGVPWALVKGISDWGYDKQDTHQGLAARNAASLVVRLIQLGDLRPHGLS